MKKVTFALGKLAPVRGNPPLLLILPGSYQQTIPFEHLMVK